jgi:hypothetical protein
VFAPEDDWSDGFRLVGGETLDDVLAQAVAQARRTEEVEAGLGDLGAPLPATIDGATCWTLMAAAEGWPQHDWVSFKAAIG